MGTTELTMDELRMLMDAVRMFESSDQEWNLTAEAMKRSIEHCPAEMRPMVEAQIKLVLEEHEQKMERSILLRAKLLKILDTKRAATLYSGMSGKTDTSGAPS